MNLAHKISITSAAIVIFAVTAVLAMAVGPLGGHANAHAEAAVQNAASAQSQSGKPSDPGSQAGTRLAAARLRACQNREHAINNIMSRIADRGQKQLTLFSTIATKVETFYTAKGNTLSNYDTLVADVTAKEAAAQNTANTIKSDSVSFRCDGTDPKGAAQSFLSDLKLEISSLKDLRASVKNLIVGVASVNGTTNPTNTTTNTNGGQQ